jgi:hypothetical protein
MPLIGMHYTVKKKNMKVISVSVCDLVSASKPLQRWAYSVLDLVHHQVF